MSEQPPQTWPEALDALERMLDGIDAQLDAEQWDATVPALLEPILANALTAAEEQRLHELVARARACEVRLAEALAATRSELEGFGKRRRAATSYTQGDGFPATA